MSAATDDVMPSWARAGERRRAHVRRVVALLEEWGTALEIGADERRAWRDAGRWHDALRDDDEASLRALTQDGACAPELLHGPAAAARLAADGERRDDVLDAIRWHTVGSAGWSRVGRALYMADFLEPGRSFARAERAFLAAVVPRDFDGAFRQVVRARLEITVRDGRPLHPRTVELWNGLA